MMKHTKLVLTATAFSIMCSAPATLAQSDIFIYPKEGQNKEQQDRDRYECHRWAVEQTGFDPSTASAPAVAATATPSQSASSAPAPGPDGSLLAGAARGAAGGAIIGEIVDDDAGKGAGVGAVVGVMRAGAKRRDRRRQEQAQAQTAQAAAAATAPSQSTQTAAYEQAYGNYRRAISGCLEARDYTVS